MPSVPGSAAAAAFSAVSGGGAERAGHGSGVADVAGEAPGVDAGDAGHAGGAEEAVEIGVGAPVAAAAGEIADDDPAGERPPALVVERGDPVVADVGIGERDDLPGVGGIGDDLLVAGHGGVEHDLAGGDTAGRGRRRWPRPRRWCRRPAPAGPRGSRSSLGLPVEHGGYPAQQGVADLAPDGAAGVGRVAGAAGQPGRVDRPLLGRIEDHQVGRLTFGHRAAVDVADAGDLGRPPRHGGQHLRQREHARLDQLGDGQGQRRLQARASRRGRGRTAPP